MIFESLCNSCLQPFVVRVSPEEAHLVGGIIGEDGLADCPRHCGGRINLKNDSVVSAMIADPRLREPCNLTLTELYQAIFGMGLPDEIPKSRETVEALLLAHPIKSVELEEEDGHFFLHKLSLANGVVLHLCAGHRGPRVLKITKGVASGPERTG
jgi:hypothetical protein